MSHHAHPNDGDHDQDARSGSPWVRFHPALPHRVWHVANAFATVAMMSLVTAQWFVTDFEYLRAGRMLSFPFFCPRSMLATQLAFKTSWLLLHVALPWAMQGPACMLAGLAVFMVVLAYLLAGTFIVNHIQDGHVPPPGQHWAVQQVLASSNWAAGSVACNLAVGGLNHQIEHHLFPAMSPYCYPHIASVVRAACEAHGLPYRTFASYPAALLGTLRHLHALGWSHAAQLLREAA